MLALVELSAALTAEQLAGAELPGAPLEPGEAIRQRFAARLDRLSLSARAALLVAAAAGHCSSAEVNAAVSRLGGVNANALGEAETAGLIRLASAGVEFSHPLVRSVAYHLASAAQRRAAHAALAETLTRPERVGWQLAAAATGPDEAAATALDTAADLAARKGAPLEAAAAWEGAAALSSVAERGTERRAEAAEAAFRGGDLDRATLVTGVRGGRKVSARNDRPGAYPRGSMWILVPDPALICPASASAAWSRPTVTATSPDGETRPSA